jgi:hypothetical protein
MNGAVVESGSDAHFVDDYDHVLDDGGHYEGHD